MPTVNVDSPDYASRYSLSSIGGSSFRSSSELNDYSPILREDEPPVTAKRSRGLINRMLGRSVSPSGESGHARAVSSISFGASNTLWAPVPINSNLHRSTSREPSPRPSLNLSRPTTPLATPLSSLPPTSNTLSNAERAEKIRRNRKVLQILGDVPFDTGDAATGDLAQDNAAALYHDLPPKTARQLRRHSSPISPVFAKEAILSPRVLRRSSRASTSSGVPSSPHPSVHSRSSRDSYFDFGPEDIEDNSERTPATPTPRTFPSSNSVASLSTIADDATGETTDAAAAERARKRATLAKLHRFLGSRVPPELVLGIPPPTAHEDENTPITAKSRRSVSRSATDPRSSTEGDGPIAYMSDGELDVRFQSRLTGPEKARIVKKKKKITKMLGDCPPSALDHRAPGGDIWPILPNTPGRSEQYTRHRYSINSLAYLVKNNDQEQLEDLLTYIRTDDKPDVSPTPDSNSASRPPSPTASLLSIQTTTTAPPPSDFQNRRRRAAKLVGFFGVEYRELFTEVLETIESEVKSDRARGSLTADEVQELLTKLRRLKIGS